MTGRRVLCARRLLAAAIAMLCVPAGSLAQDHPASHAQPDVSAPDIRVSKGVQLPDVALISEDSTTFHVSDLFGKPVLISPVFTACPHTCGFITASLRDALAEIGAPEDGYHVITVSFDPADDPAALRAYKEKMELPDGWRLAVASSEDLAALMDAIDFRWSPMDGGGFAHANVLAVIGSDLRVSGYLHGVMYDPAEVRAALEKAANDASLVRRARPVILGVVILGALTMTTVLVLTRRRQA
jgi:cytochrome oxidase Cu insertion factor (SCO1/SenC/PrrC family)